jgi:hypothetical protein
MALVGHRLADRIPHSTVIQRYKLNDRADELSAMLRFVDARILWLRGGATGPPPEPSVSGDVLAMSRAPRSNARR